MNVIIYTRTSTKSQDISSQIGSLLRESDNNDWCVLNLFKDEGISGSISDRKGLNTMIDFIKNNKIDKIVVSEISRIGRNIEFLKTFIQEMCDKGISIWVNDFKYETLINGKINVNMLSLLFKQIEYAESELKSVEGRLKRGYDEFRNSGGKVGRKEGFKKSPINVLMEHEDVCNFLHKGYSTRVIMDITNKSSGTVQKVKKILGEQGFIFETKVKKIDLYKQLLKNNVFLNDL